ALGKRAGAGGVQDLALADQLDLVGTGAGDDSLSLLGAAGDEAHASAMVIVHPALADAGVDVGREIRGERHRRRMVAVPFVAEKSREGETCCIHELPRNQGSVKVADGSDPAVFGSCVVVGAAAPHLPYPSSPRGRGGEKTLLPSGREGPGE